LDYFGARYYKAAAAKFTQADPLTLKIALNEEVKNTTGQDLQQLLQNPQVLNSYAYAGDNPVKYTDPDGQSWRTFGQGLASSFVYAYHNPVKTLGALAIGTVAVIAAPAATVVAGAVIGGVAIGTAVGNAITASDADTRDYYLGQGTTAAVLTGIGLKGANSSNVLKNSSLLSESGSQINSVKNILQPNGKLIGAAGTDNSIRVMAGGISEAQELFNSLTGGGKLIQNSIYSGTLMEVEGGYIGIRSIQTKSPNTISTIDININNVPITKIKFNP